MRNQNLVSEVVSILKERGFEVTATETEKNGVKLDAIICDNGTDARPVVYIDDTQTAEENAECMEKLLNSCPKVSFNLKRVSSYESAKPYIRAGICSNGKHGKDVAVIPFLDLEIYAFVTMDADGLGSGIIRITNDMLKEWNVSADLVIHEAMEASFARASVNNIVDMLLAIAPRCAMSEQMEEIELLSKNGVELPMWVLSSDNLLYGAINLANATMLSNLSERLDSDLFVIPSSIHEIIALPAKDDADIEELKHMVNFVNNTEVPETEILSDSVYRFDRKKKELTLAR